MIMIQLIIILLHHERGYVRSEQGRLPQKSL